jgi:NADH dehydrogenase (ubiquinone) 1 alpha subcomplex subunit 9
VCSHARSDWPIWWKLNNAETKTRPVHVCGVEPPCHGTALIEYVQILDVAQALTNLATMGPMAGTYSLPGPSTLTYDYLLSLIQSLTYRPETSSPTLPKAAALALSKLAQNVWWPALSPDEVERRYLNDVETPGDWATFGVEPTEIEPVAITYLRRYRSAFVSLLQTFLPFTDAHSVMTMPARSSSRASVSTC